MPAVATKNFIEHVLDFDRAQTNGQKSRAVRGMLETGDELYGHHENGDRVTHELAQQEQEAVTETLNGLSASTRICVGIVREAVMAKILLKQGEKAYHDVVDNLVNEHLQPGTPPDEFATASLALSAVTADVSNADTIALEKTADYAFALNASPRQDHFANENGSTNQSVALELMENAVKTARAKLPSGEVTAEMLTDTTRRKYDLIVKQNGQDAMQAEWKKDEYSDPLVMLLVHERILDAMKQEKQAMLGTSQPNAVTHIFGLDNI